MAPEAQSVERSAQSWLQNSCQVQVPFAWLQACVQWLQEEAGGAGRLTQQQINKQVYDQWLLTDLRDLDHPVLPDGLAQSQKTLLSGIFCVQIDSVLDVSQPAYGQLQKVKGTDCANDEVSAVTQFTQRPWEARPTRMLLLQVTDGVQNMEAMEYQPISALSTALRPGVKLRLQGDIPCRLGVMLLGPTNVKLLGGEVEDLVDRNQQGRVLCRALGLPEEEEEEEQPQPGGNEPPPAQQGNQDIVDLDVDDQELLASLEAQEQAEHPGGAGLSRDSGYGTRSDSTQSSGSSAAWNHSSTASSRSVMSTSSLRNSPLPSSIRARSSTWSSQNEEPDFSDHVHPDPPIQGQSMADEDFDDLPLDELDSVVLQPPPVTHVPNTHTMNTPPDFPDEDMDFTEDQGDTGSEQPKLNATEIDRNIASSPPFTYICLLDNTARTDNAEIVVKAFIVTLLGKLSSNNGFWQVSATISDGTGYLDVELSDEVLKGLLGFSVAEKALMKRDPARKGELEAGMKRCQEGLVDMCCLMSIRLDKEGSGKAVVTKAEAVKEQDLQALEERVRVAM